MSKKASIPDSADPSVQALAQNVRRITGQLKNEPPLSPVSRDTVTLPELADAFNNLLRRMQGE